MKKKPKAKAKPKKRATEAQMHLRVDKVAELLISGRTRSFVLQYCSDQYELADRAADELISRATEEIRKFDTTIEEVRARVVSGFYTQYRKLQKDPVAASGILQKVADIYGLNQKNVHVKVNRPLAGTSDEDLAAAAALPDKGHE